MILAGVCTVLSTSGGSFVCFLGICQALQALTLPLQVLPMQHGHAIQSQRDLLPYSAFTSFRTAFEEPNVEEGFSEVRKVNWVFEGDEDGYLDGYDEFVAGYAGARGLTGWDGES